MEKRLKVGDVVIYDYGQYPYKIKGIHEPAGTYYLKALKCGIKHHCDCQFIPASQLELLKPLTKSDLKNKQLIEFNIEYIIYNENNGLPIEYDISDIIKVYEFDKLVYDRSWFEDDNLKEIDKVDDKIELLRTWLSCEIKDNSVALYIDTNTERFYDKINELTEAVNELKKDKLDNDNN